MVIPPQLPNANDDLYVDELQFASIVQCSAALVVVVQQTPAVNCPSTESQAKDQQLEAMNGVDFLEVGCEKRKINVGTRGHLQNLTFCTCQCKDCIEVVYEEWIPVIVDAVILTTSPRLLSMTKPTALLIMHQGIALLYCLMTPLPPSALIKSGKLKLIKLNFFGNGSDDYYDNTQPWISIHIDPSSVNYQCKESRPVPQGLTRLNFAVLQGSIRYRENMLIILGPQGQTRTCQDHAKTVPIYPNSIATTGGPRLKAAAPCTAHHLWHAVGFFLFFALEAHIFEKHF